MRIAKTDTGLFYIWKCEHVGELLYYVNRLGRLGWTNCIDLGSMFRYRNIAEKVLVELELKELKKHTDDIEIHETSGNNRWYICRPDGNGRYNDSVEYLHRDLTWHERCGSANFYKNKAEADYYVTMYKIKIGVFISEPFIEEKEMLL